MHRIVIFTLALAGVAQALAAEPRTDRILIQGNAAGTQTVQIEPGGAVRVEYSYNDRGRAITSLPPGSSMPMACRSNTTAAATIT